MCTCIMMAVACGRPSDSSDAGLVANGKFMVQHPRRKGVHASPWPLENAAGWQLRHTVPVEAAMVAPTLRAGEAVLSIAWNLHPSRSSSPDRPAPGCWFFGHEWLMVNKAWHRSCKGVIIVTYGHHESIIWSRLAMISLAIHGDVEPCTMNHDSHQSGISSVHDKL